MSRHVFHPHRKPGDSDLSNLHEGIQFQKCSICGRWRSKYVKIDESGACGECAEFFPTKESLALKKKREEAK